MEAVLEWLRPEFPEVTISKIRFLEAEGVVQPQRSASGYRRFSEADCARLRFVLATQRDRHVPLSAIKEELSARLEDRLDEVAESETLPRMTTPGHGSSARRQGATRHLGVVAEGASPRDLRLRRAELLAESGVDERFLAELIRARLIVPGPAGFFEADAVTVARTAGQLAEFGYQVRHLRSFVLAADREASLVAQVVAPIAKGHDSEATSRAEETVRELTALTLALHATLLRASVRDSLQR